MKLRFLHTTLFFIAGFLLQAQPKVFRGEIDVRSYDFSHGIIQMEGEWEFYWKKLYFPEDFKLGRVSEKPVYTKFLDGWSAFEKPASWLDPQTGFATYRLVLKIDENTPQLALYIPLFYSNYELYVNGMGVESNGNVGEIKETSVPGWRPTSRVLELKPGENELIVLVSNFHHHKGGAYKPLLLGESGQVNLRRNFGIGASFFLAGCLLIAGALAFGLFWFNRTDYSGLFFFLFCMSYAYRALGTDEYVIHSAITSLSWNTALRLEYASLYLSVLFYGYFIRNLITTKIPTVFFHINAAISTLAVLSLFLPTTTFSAFIDYYLIFLIAAVVYVSIMALLSMNFTHKMSWFTLSGAIVLAIVALMKIGVHLKLMQEYIWIHFIGYIVFIFTQAIALIIRFGRNLRESNSAAAVASKSRAEFLNTMSHELRTPMNAILGMSEFLSKTELSATQKEKVSTIQKNGESLLAIILDILSISEIEAGKVRLEKKPLSVEECLRGAVNLALKERQNKPIDMEINIDPEIPDRLIGDATRIKQIFMNLVGNAFKFTEKGKVTINGQLHNATEEHIELHFTVTDTGIGIAPSKLKSLTKAFSQEQTGNTRKYGGTGLGLSVVKDLVKHMNGSLEIESEKGKGTKARVLLQLELPKVTLRDESFVPAVSQEIDKDLKVLYAEDNPVNQKLLVMMMKTFGLDIDVAENGKVAWHKALEKNYNIILMDLQMPEMDGFEATRRIIEDVRTRPIIIAVTANASSADRKKCFETGMNDFISKPIKADVLKQGIVKWQGLRKYLDENDERSRVFDISS